MTATGIQDRKWQVMSWNISLNQEIPLEILRHVCDEDPLKGAED